jgi:hypothetical protein
MDGEVAETLAGVVRLLRRAAALVWQQVIREGPGAARQVLAVGIDIVADEAAMLLLPCHPAAGPAPVGDNPVRLLRSAEQLLARLNASMPAPALEDLRDQVVELVWEANTGANT